MSCSRTSVVTTGGVPGFLVTVALVTSHGYSREAEEEWWWWVGRAAQGLYLATELFFERSRAAHIGRFEGSGRGEEGVTPTNNEWTTAQGVVISLWLSISGSVVV